MAVFETKVFDLLEQLAIFDWFIQYMDLRQSTDIRRMITGIIDGYSPKRLYCLLIKFVIELIQQKL